MLSEEMVEKIKIGLEWFIMSFLSKKILKI